MQVLGPVFWISRRWAGSEAAKSKKNKLTVKNSLKNKLKGSAALLAKKCDDFSRRFFICGSVFF